MRKHVPYPWLKAVLMMLVFLFAGLLNGIAATYYLNSANLSSRNAHLATNWCTGTGGTGSQAANFTTSGDIFIVPGGISGIIPNGQSLTIGSGVTLELIGSLSLGVGGAPTTVELSIASSGTIVFSDATEIQLKDGNSGASSTLTFSLSSGSNLKTAHTNGISGSVQTNLANSPILLNFNEGANYEFSGTTQTTNGLPATVNNLIFSGSGTKTLASTLTTISGSFSLNGTASVTSANGITVNGNMSLASGTTFNAGSFSHVLKGNLTNSGTFTGNTSTLTLNGTSQQTIGGGTIDFNNLTIDNALGVKASSDLTVNGVLDLHSANPNATDGTLDMVIAYGDYSNVLTEEAALITTFTQAHDILSSYILFMGANATTTGQGDVIGKVKRTSFVEKTAYTFGNQYTTISFNANTTGSLPDAMLFVITKGSDRGIHSNKTTAVARLFQVIRTGGTTPTTFTVRFKYEDSELNSNHENDLILWDHHIPYATTNTPHEHGKTGQSTSENWVELSGHGITYLTTNMDQDFGGTIRSKYWMIHSKVSTYNTWLAAAAPPGHTDWSLSENWSSGVPTSASDVKIPGSGVSHYPVLTGNIAAKSIYIEAGATFNLPASIELTLSGGIDTTGGNGSIVNNGTFTAAAGFKNHF
jgi:trimeric autotransporter adhesin